MNTGLRRVLPALCGAWLAGAPAFAAPPQLPARIETSYQVLYNGMPLGELKESFQRRGGAYRITSHTEPGRALAFLPGARQSMSSEGSVDRNGLRPARFRHTRGDDARKSASAAFDWSRGELTMSRGDETKTVALAAGAQDRLSALYQLPFLSLDGVQEVRIPITNGRKLSTYRYQVLREDTDTPMGRFKTLHLVGQTEDADRRQEVWVATDRRYLVVRLVLQERAGERFEQVLTGLRVEPAAP